MSGCGEMKEKKGVCCCEVSGDGSLVVNGVGGDRRRMKGEEDEGVSLGCVAEDEEENLFNFLFFSFSCTVHRGSDLFSGERERER